MSVEAQIEQIQALRDKALAARDRAVLMAEKLAQEAADCETAITVLRKIAPPREDRINLHERINASNASGDSLPIWKRILDTMSSSKKTWWTANELQDALGEAGTYVKMTSISPNLTRLKESGEIVRDELKVALANRAAPKTEGPEDDLLGGNSSGPSNHDRPSQSVETQAEGREAEPGGGP